MNTLGVTSPWYRNAVYFYLHFQYNGWMPMALLGLLIFAAEKNGVICQSESLNGCSDA